MYNFLVTAQDDAWDEPRYEYPRGRFLEYTDDDIAEKFRELKDPQIETLLKLPCLFAYEGSVKAMRIGRLTKVRVRERVIYIEFEIDEKVRPIPFKKLAPLKSALDIRDWELNRTHWAIKNEDLEEILAKAKVIPARRGTRTIRKANLPPPPAPELQAGSVGEFVEKILKLDNGSREVFYRGHSNRAKFRLEPSLFRKDDKGNFKYLDAEDRLYRELLVSNSVDFQGDIYTLDRLIRMQHYYLPTRLMDITSNPLIALYFACKEDRKEIGEVIAFALDKERVKYFDSDTASCIANLARLPKTSKDEVDYTITGVEEFNGQPAVKRLLHFIREEKPFFEPRLLPDDLKSIVCVKGKHTTSRIAFQSGAFLLFGHDASLDESGTDQIELSRIAITDKLVVLKQLDSLNINESSVFPYIENSAKYIAEKFSFRG
jgi:hypothetical protein